MSVLVKIKQKCTRCNGNDYGYIYDPHCTRCYQRIPKESAFWQSDSNELPCGHSLRNLLEEYPCPECEGKTSVEQWVTLSELRNMMKADEAANA